MMMAAGCCLAAMAAVPQGYYASLNGKKGQALKEAIHDLTMRHTVLTYSSLWNYFPQTDCRLDDKSQVWDMYSNKAYYFSQTPGWSTSGMHKEHSMPKSWWGGDERPAYTDIMHLYPADGDANMAKSNFPLGEVSTATFDNGCTRVGTPKTGQGGGASTVFEPDDRYKGDFARTYFYMACAYQDYSWKYNYMLSNGSWLTLNQWSIDLLLKWARQDPVSDKEMARNEAVYRCQNNRNPFIDNPNLIEYVWGDKAGEVYVDGGEVTGDPELLSPAQDTRLSFGEVALGRSTVLTLNVKGLNLNNSLTVTIYRDDAAMFGSSVSSVDRATACSADGYPLVITYTPTALGDHKTRLVISDGGLTGSVGCELSGRCLPPPSLSGVHALPATEVTDSTFTANWEPLGAEQLDSYIITRVTWDGETIDDVTEIEVDAEQTSYEFTDRNRRMTYTYSVRSVRLGYESAESNIVTLDKSGITGVLADKPAAFLATQGGVIAKCSEPIEDVSIYNMAGARVARLDVMQCDDIIALPMGVYVVTSRQSTQATKVVVRY